MVSAGSETRRSGDMWSGRFSVHSVVHKGWLMNGDTEMVHNTYDIKILMY